MTLFHACVHRKRVGVNRQAVHPASIAGRRRYIGCYILRFRTASKKKGKRHEAIIQTMFTRTYARVAFTSRCGARPRELKTCKEKSAPLGFRSTDDAVLRARFHSKAAIARASCNPRTAFLYSERAHMRAENNFILSASTAKRIARGLMPSQL